MSAQFIHLWRRIWKTPWQVGEMALHLTSRKDIVLNPTIYGFSLAMHLCQSFGIMHIPYKEKFPLLFSSRPILFCFLLIAGGILGQVLSCFYSFVLYLSLRISSINMPFSQVRGLITWTMAPTLLTFLTWNVALWTQGLEVLSWKWQLTLFNPLQGGMRSLVFFLGLIYMTVLCISVFLGGLSALTLGDKSKMSWTLCWFLVLVTPLALFFPMAKVLSLIM